MPDARTLRFFASLPHKGAQHPVIDGVRVSVLRRGTPSPMTALRGRFVADYYPGHGELLGSSNLIAAIHMVRLVGRKPDMAAPSSREIGPRQDGST